MSDASGFLAWIEDTAVYADDPDVPWVMVDGEALPVEPDYEAAAKELHEQSADGEDTYEAAKATVDAALRLGGDDE